MKSKKQTSSYEIINVDISRSTQEKLARMYVTKNLQPPCVETFEEELKNNDVERALFVAVLNEITLNACFELISNMKLETGKSSKSRKQVAGKSSIKKGK